MGETMFIIIIITFITCFLLVSEGVQEYRGEVEVTPWGFPFYGWGVFTALALYLGAIVPGVWPLQLVGVVCFISCWAFKCYSN